MSLQHWLPEKISRVLRSGARNRAKIGTALAACLLLALHVPSRAAPDRDAVPAGGAGTASVHAGSAGEFAPLTLFGFTSKETYPLARMHNSGVIARWREVMGKHAKDNAFAPGNNAMKVFMRRQWETLTAKYAGMSPEERLRTVGAFFNHIPSKTDQANHGQKEYWAYPAEFIRKNGGDCEDYALAKYLALRHFGWPDQNMWLVLVTDLKRKADHAVLAVNLDGRVFILDNLSRPKDLIMLQSSYTRQYSPILAVNGLGIWNFSLQVKPQTRPPARQAQKQFSL